MSENRYATWFRPTRAFGLILAAAGSLVLSLGGLPAQGSGPSSPTGAAVLDAHAALDPAKTVTLITGDQVTVQPAGAGEQPHVAIHPATRPGRIPTFQTYYEDGHAHVLPADVAGLVPDVLDPELFDVTAQIQMGYDDASRSDIPLIVAHRPGAQALAAPLARTGDLPSIGASAAELPKAGAGTLGADLNTVRTARDLPALLAGATHIWLDRKVEAAELDRNLTDIGAPAAWDAGLSGAGVKVAVLDSGIDSEHPDLAGQVDATANFTDDDTPGDDNGHGTHVASLLAGTGAKADGARRGVAYGARLISGKVLAANGSGQASWLIEAMQWAVDQHSDIVNMSLGGPAEKISRDDPVVDSLEALTASSGTLFVVAAGNSGWTPGSIESPGVAPSALTVSTLSDYASQGPTKGDYRLKPDIIAPANEIIGARAGARTSDFYTTMTGTSQATPQVAGAAALLMQQHPGWNWQQVKSTLVDSATVIDDQLAYAQGGGLLDLSRATTAKVSADVSGIDFGYVRWPDRDPRSRQVTLSNSTDSPVTLDLELALREGFVDDIPPTPGMVTVSPRTLSIPAGGSASATVTLNPGIGKADTYSGFLDITGSAGNELQIPVGFYDEPEIYDVSVQVLDRQGKPYAGGQVSFINADKINGGGSLMNVTLDADGRTTQRIRPGYFSIESAVIDANDDGSMNSVALIGQREVHISKSASFTLDARTALPLRRATVPDVPTRVDEAQIFLDRVDPTGLAFGDAIIPSAADLNAGKILVQPAGPVTHGRLVLTTRWRLAPTHPRAGEPGLYELLLPSNTIGAPQTYRLTQADIDALARIDTTYYGLGSVSEGGEAREVESDVVSAPPVRLYPIPLPGKRIELVSAGPDIHWKQQLRAAVAGGADLQQPDYTSYQEGQRTSANWLRTLRTEYVEPYRWPNQQWVATALGDGEHVGAYAAGLRSSTLRLNRNGQFLASAQGHVKYFHVPRGDGDFAAEQKATYDASLPVSPKSDTTWTFTSHDSGDSNSYTNPSIVNLDYRPTLQMTGFARAGKSLPMGLRITHVSGSPDNPGSAREVSLAYSVDAGRTWHPLTLTRTGANSFTTLIPGDLLEAGKNVSVKASAQDGVGSGVQQTITGLFPVR